MSIRFEVHPTKNRKWQWRLVEIVGTVKDPIARGTDYQDSEAECRIEVQVIKQTIMDAPVVKTRY